MAQTQYHMADQACMWSFLILVCMPKNKHVHDLAKKQVQELMSKILFVLFDIGMISFADAYWCRIHLIDIDSHDIQLRLARGFNLDTSKE